MNKIITHWTFPLFTLLILLLVQIKDPIVTEIARLKQFDLLQQLDKPVMSNDVAILEIDEASIEKYGQWPWKRTVMADLIGKLRYSGANVIVLPILFSEEDRLGGDGDLAYTIKDNGIVIAQVGSNNANKNGVERGVAKIGDPIPYLFEWKGMLGPIPELGKVADGVGVINSVPEVDGVVRRLPLLMRVGEEVYPSVALEVLRVAVRDPSYQVKANEGGIVAMRVPGFTTVNTDQNGRIWLRWNKQFQTVSASQNDFSELEGKVVIIGTTAEGIGGVVASPTGEQYSHQAIATSLQTVLDGENIQRPYWAKLAEISLVFFIGILIIVLTRFTPYFVVGLSIILLLGGLQHLTINLWQNNLYLFDITIASLVVLLVGMHSIFNRFILEFRLKQQIKKQFEHYLAPAMVQKLQKNPELLKLGGETRNMTFLFCDIRGFTPISEKYKGNPEGLTKLINRFLTRMTDVIISHGGTIDKFMGDCIMAFWNAPLDVNNHAELAVKSAKVMMDELKMLNIELKLEKLPEINIGIGINTGEALVGNMGSDQRFDYSVIGDDVNLASRLESSSKTLGHTLVIGQNTVDAIGEGEFLYIDKITVKGKTEEIKVYTLVEKRKKKNV
jgi:adenylate cyclase